MSKRLWNIGMKCPDLEAEVAFHRAMGHEIVIEKETVVIEGKEQSQALIRVGDKYLVVAEHWGLEMALSEPLAYGATHMSHSVDDLDAEIEAALAGGATPASRARRDRGRLRPPPRRLFPLTRWNGVLPLPRPRRPRSGGVKGPPDDNLLQSESGVRI